MTDEELEKLIDDMAEIYAEDNKSYIRAYKLEEISDYVENKRKFIDGFKAGLNFKEESLTYLKKKCVDFQRPLQNETLF